MAAARNRILELEKQLAIANAEARTDYLTGLPNLLGFTINATRMLELGKRQGNWVSTIIYLDLIDLKTANDTHGHGCGDKILKCAADVIKWRIRETDLAARIHGDEFAIFIQNNLLDTPSDIVRDINQRLREELREQSLPERIFRYGTSSRRLFSSSAVTIEEMLEEADPKGGHNSTQGIPAGVALPEAATMLRLVGE